MSKKALWILILGFLFLSGPSRAAETKRDFGAYPPYQTKYLTDYARVISPGDAQQIQKMFKDLEYQTGIEAAVLTINSISDYQTGDDSIESFATRLFNAWGVGNKITNSGILILVAVKDRKCRIELGSGWPSSYNQTAKTVIDEKMIPYFKSGDYSRGIYEGCRGVIEKFTKKISWWEFHKWHLILGALFLFLLLAGFSCLKSGKSGWGWAFFAAAGVVLLFLLNSLAKGRSGSSGSFGGGRSSGGGASGSW